MTMNKRQSPARVAIDGPKQIVIAEGTLEALKWIALVLMTLDHFNKYLYDHTLPVLFELGRIAMPLFGFVLAYNLARPDALQRGLFGRTIRRLALFGVLATPFFLSLGQLVAGWRPLNIMFTLLTASVTIYLLRRGGLAYFAGAVVVFFVGGALVEFWWFGLLFCITAWLYCAKPRKLSLSLWLASTAMLYFANQNFWALAALPIIGAAPYVTLNLPRVRYAFYAYYPAHLALLAAISVINR